MEHKTKILLAEDHQIVRDGIEALLTQEDHLEVVAVAANGKEAVELAISHQPDVVIMDINMPEMNGIEATRQIKQKQPGCKVIALSMHQDKEYVLNMFRAGTVGFLLKFNAIDELIIAITKVLRGERYLSSEIPANFLDDLNLSERPQTLTAREREVLGLVAEGLSTKEIASKLNVSAKTIGTHREKIMKKLKIHSIAELTKYAIREGITTLDSP